MILSPDHFLMHADGSYDWTPSRVASAWAITIEKARTAIHSPRNHKLVLLVGLPGAGKTTWLQSHQEPSTVYVDATFTKRSERAVFISIAADANRPIQAIVFSTPFEECLRRNSLRSVDRSVPMEKMTKLWAQLQDTPPGLDEGFDEIRIVTGT